MKTGGGLIKIKATRLTRRQLCDRIAIKDMPSLFLERVEGEVFACFDTPIDTVYPTLNNQKRRFKEQRRID